MVAGEDPECVNTHPTSLKKHARRNWVSSCAAWDSRYFTWIWKEGSLENSRQLVSLAGIQRVYGRISWSTSRLGYHMTLPLYIFPAPPHSPPYPAKDNHRRKISLMRRWKKKKIREEGSKKTGGKYQKVSELLLDVHSLITPWKAEGVGKRTKPTSS